MKKFSFLLILCLCLLLCVGCKDKNAQDSSNNAQNEEETVTLVIDEALLGVWASAKEGSRDMVETLYFYENGAMIIELRYEGEPYGTLYGSYTIDGHMLRCDITEGTTPYKVDYEYRIDGRMLTLTDDDGPANYLRTS